MHSWSCTISLVNLAMKPKYVSVITQLQLDACSVILLRDTKTPRVQKKGEAKKNQ